jgi:histone-lysine N-methyltransferase SUV39H
MSMTPQRKVYGKEYAPPHVLARDIPCGLANIVNSLEWWQRDPVLLREVFEEAMVANTTPDEPEAPCIGVYNNVDDEPSPPFEFYYSNLMWHGEGVPPPDWENLEGCDCFGVCDPYGDCACARRQKEAMGDHYALNGFIYDAKGKLKIHNFPIIECNDKCQCTDDCKNRVSAFLGNTLILC